MFYEFSVTLLKGTSQANATITECKLEKGIIHRVEIQFPAGCHFLAKCQLKLKSLHQVWPKNTDGYIAGEFFPIVFDEYYPLKRPYIINWVAWNDDDTYSHTLKLRIGLLPEKDMPLTLRVSSALQQTAKILTKWLSGEEEIPEAIE